tara:strand:- start:390 stop:764 length:375 start_codon:yes stop_codon:yes gene_type:complete
MAYFARLDKNNKVIRVSSVNDAEVPTEQAGIDFLIRHNGGVGWYKQTYIDGSKRKNYASRGYIYDPNKDAFIAPKPQHYPSWVLNEDTCRWEAPTPMPDDGKKYEWNESTTSWDEFIKINDANT